MTIRTRDSKATQNDAKQTISICENLTHLMQLISWAPKKKVRVFSSKLIDLFVQI